MTKISTTLSFVAVTSWNGTTSSDHRISSVTIPARTARIFKSGARTTTQYGERSTPVVTRSSWQHSLTTCFHWYCSRRQILIVRFTSALSSTRFFSCSGPSAPRRSPTLVCERGTNFSSIAISSSIVARLTRSSSSTSGSRRTTSARSSVISVLAMSRSSWICRPRRYSSLRIVSALLRCHRSFGTPTRPMDRKTTSSVRPKALAAARQSATMPPMLRTPARKMMYPMRTPATMPRTMYMRTFSLIACLKRAPGVNCPAPSYS
mmetsp:Transcript_5423/g.17110  ORF Transcript_5423/g.17110 Transcript_5423/m.17110 type:complete len:263 (-) Transcript_5423:409-1197(-)